METINDKFLYFLYWTAIFVVSGSMLVYGLAKPIQFQELTNSPDSGLSEGHQIMWAFYSYTKAYPIIIGLFEVIGAIAILFGRTRIFGCLLLTVILTNIIIQDYLYEISALSSGIFYQVLVLFILFFDFEKLKSLILELFKPHKINRNFILLIIAIIASLVVKYFEAEF